MIDRKTIEEILKAGVQAPSGSNSQPWKFAVKDGVVTVFALYEKDHPILNYRNRGTLLAHGALLKNIAIAAREYGYHAEAVLFPKGEGNIVSEISFVEVPKESQSVYAAIFRRSINRKPYAKKALSDEEEINIKAAIEGVGGGVSVVFIEDAEKISTLAEAASISERVIFENEALHKLLFEEIVWTKEEENKKKEGLFLKTLEINKAQQFLLKFLKNWNTTKKANKIGFSKMLAKGNADIYKSTPLMGVIQVTDEDKSFIEAGEVMEMLWLRATEMGLSFHILTGVSFLWQQITLGNKNIFSEEQIKTVQDAYGKIKEVSKTPEGKIATLMFRIGHSEEPSARSSKKEAEISFE